VERERQLAAQQRHLEEQQRAAEAQRALQAERAELERMRAAEAQKARWLARLAFPCHLLQRVRTPAAVHRVAQLSACNWTIPSHLPE